MVFFFNCDYFRVTFPQTLDLNNFVKEFEENATGSTSNNCMQPSNSVTTNGGNVGSTSSEHGSVESAIKCDDCSTTDSESAIEEENYNGANNTHDNNLAGILNGNINVNINGHHNTPPNNTKNNYNNNINMNNNNNNASDIPEEDEGIDMTTSTEHKNTSLYKPGQYIYELFAIMIHSGSASGGHYYAYIKEFETGEWFCFNDQSVTPVS